MAIWSSGAGNNGIWAPDPLYGGIWASDMQRAISRAFITDNGGTTLLNASTGYINPNITFSRASNGMVCDQDGNWTWTSLPYRRSYDMQTKEWGYLFEPQRTNLHIGVGAYIPSGHINGATGEITNEVRSAVEGAAVLKITTEPNNGAFDNGLPWPDNAAYIAKYTPGEAARLLYQEDGFANTPASASLFVMAVSAPCQVMIAVGRGHNDLALSDKVVISAEPGIWKRISATGEDGENDNRRHIIKTAGDIYICCPQFETGAVATSPIATNGSQVTVAADVCTYANSVLTDAVGTVLARVFSGRADLAGQNAYILDNWMFLRDTTKDVYLWDGNGPRSTAISSPLTAVTSTNKTSSSSTVLAQGGTETAQASGAQAMPIGSIVIGSSLGGYINHLSVFPTQLTAPKRATAASFTKF